MKLAERARGARGELRASREHYSRRNFKISDPLKHALKLIPLPVKRAASGSFKILAPLKRTSAARFKISDPLKLHVSRSLTP